MDQFETERLIIRPLTLADAPAIQSQVSDREIAATTLNIPHPYPEGGAEQWIIRAIEGFEKRSVFNFAIVRKADEQLIGCIAIEGVKEPHRKCEIGYWIGRPHWGQGYATEAARAVLAFAFDELGANKVWAQFFMNNPASGKVMQKLGMTHEGTHRQDICKWGEFLDVGTYSILRSEYKAL